MYVCTVDRYTYRLAMVRLIETETEITCGLDHSDQRKRMRPRSGGNEHVRERERLAYRSECEHMAAGVARLSYILVHGVLHVV